VGGGKRERDLLVLVESDPDMELIHGLPEEKRAEAHPEEGGNSHHSFFSARVFSRLQNQDLFFPSLILEICIYAH
jgi:hypothetical protein